MDMTVEEVKRFVFNEDNQFNCAECPYNNGYDDPSEYHSAGYTVGPCGQQHCFVTIHCNH